MLAVITLTSSVLGGIAVLLHGVWRTERSVSDHRTHMTVLFRVAELFRADANAGELAAPEPVPGGPAVDQIALSYPNDRTLEYRAADAQIERIVRIGGAITHRDTFRLAPNSSASWRLEADEPRRLTLQVVRRAPKAGPDLGERKLRVEARLQAIDSMAPAPEPTL
jgi:hypothetical protein